MWPSLSISLDFIFFEADAYPIIMLKKSVWIEWLIETFFVDDEEEEDDT